MLRIPKKEAEAHWPGPAPTVQANHLRMGSSDTSLQESYKRVLRYLVLLVRSRGCCRKRSSLRGLPNGTGFASKFVVPRTTPSSWLHKTRNTTGRQQDRTDPALTFLADGFASDRTRNASMHLECFLSKLNEGKIKTSATNFGNSAGLCLSNL